MENKINTNIKLISSRGELNKFRDYAIENKIPIIGKEVEEFIIFEILSRDIKNILEIGTAIGYSGAVFMDQKNDIYLHTIEKNKERAEEADRNFKALGYEGRYEIFNTDAKESLAQLTGPYDLIFIDGPKSQYQKYFDMSLDLLSDDGLIICDNVLFRGYVTGPQENIPKRFKSMVNKLEEFNKNVLERDDVISLLLDIGDGLLLGKKNI